MKNKKNSQSIAKNIIEALVKCGVPRKKINKKYNFVKSKDIDSLSIFSFISEIEKKFFIKFNIYNKINFTFFKNF